MSLINSDSSLKLDDLMLNPSSERKNLNLKQTQLHAHQVMSKDLQIFPGDPQNCPIFIANCKVQETFQQKGFATEWI